MMRALAGILIVILLGAGAAGFPAAPAEAKPAWFRVAADERVDLSEAIRLVKRRYGDVEVLKAETKRRGDRVEHRIRVLTRDGRVRDVRVDASTGEFR